MPRRGFDDDRPFERPEEKVDPKKDPWIGLQKTVYRPLQIRTASGIKKIPMVEAYHDRLTEEAAGGSVSAAKELVHILRYLNRAERRRAKTDLRDCKPKKSIHEIQFDLVERLTAQVIFSLKEEIRPAFEQAHGPLVAFDDYVPRSVDRERYDQLLPGFAADRRRLLSRGEVGPKRPPVHSRFAPGQSGNPSGKRRETDATWVALRNSLMTVVSTTVGGKRGGTTLIGAACSHLFKKAIQGEAEARVLVRALIIMLDERGLLHEPKPRPRFTRRKDYEANLEVMRGFVRHVWKAQRGALWDETLTDLTRRFGPIPGLDYRPYNPSEGLQETLLRINGSSG